MTERLSAYRGDEQPWRYERLARVANLICKAGLSHDVVELHDHKGTLTVLLNSRLAPEQEAFVRKTWCISGESEDNVEFKTA